MNNPRLRHLFLLEAILPFAVGFCGSNGVMRFYDWSAASTTSVAEAFSPFLSILYRSSGLTEKP
jgi:hypothetical protein